MPLTSIHPPRRWRSAAASSRRGIAAGFAHRLVQIAVDHRRWGLGRQLAVQGVGAAWSTEDQRWRATVLIQQPRGVTTAIVIDRHVILIDRVDGDLVTRQIDRCGERMFAGQAFDRPMQSGRKEQRLAFGRAAAEIFSMSGRSRYRASGRPRRGRRCGHCRESAISG